MSNNKFTTISTIGRQGLIQKIADSYSDSTNEVPVGIGDDAAVLRKNEKEFGLLSSETYTEGVDFDPTFTPMHHLGAKLLTAAVSDIYAMNGKPTAILINLAIPNRVSVEMIEQLYKGFQQGCKDYDCTISGGDVSASHGALTISLSVYGVVEQNKLVRRKGAKIDDAICLSGDIGGAMAGLRILLREKQHWQDSGIEVMEPDLSSYQYVVQRQLLPFARKDLISGFEENNIVPSAMTDISMGLINDLSNLCRASEVGAYIYQAAIPIHLETRDVANELEEEVDKYAMFGGEDYELLFTLPEKDVDAFSKKFNDFVVIGKINVQKNSVKVQLAEGDIWEFEDGKQKI